MKSSYKIKLAFKDFQNFFNSALRMNLILEGVKSGDTVLQVEENFTESSLNSALWIVDFQPRDGFNIESNVRDDKNGKDTREYTY